MNIIITGSNGFIGQNLIKFIHQSFPTSKIFCLVRNPKKNTPNITYECVNYYDLSTLKNSEILNTADYIFHLAGVTKGISKQDFINGNVIPTKNLLETIKNNKNLKRFVFISSLAASGPSKFLEKPKNENDLDEPVEFYGESKLMAEQIVLEYSATIPITIIRPSAVYGPKDLDFLNIFNMINKNFSIFHGNKNDYMSMIFVEDLVKGIMLAGMSENTINKIYYLTHPKKISWLEFHKISAEILNKKTFEINIPNFFLDILALFGEIYSKIFRKPCIFNKQKIKMAKYKYWICSHEKALEDFGFVAETDLKAGLKITLNCKK
jgi:nucleoside-diphosphate-sugar epimerase